MEEPKLIKQMSLTDKAILRQKKILIVAVMFVVTLFIGSSYALLTNFDKTSEVINIKVGNMNASVTTNESISLENKLPETDASGKQNATPVEITITNTGTINIQKYEIKLLSEEGKTSTLEYQYIKYAISLDGTNYLEAKNLNDSNNIVYTGYNLKTDNNKKTKIIYLKVWIDETAGNNGLNKTFYGALSVDLYQKAEVPGSEKILEVANSIPSCTRTVTDTDGTVYISGNSDNPSIYSNAATDDCVIDFNYVWWSGKMWRITAIYPDGAMKMVTDNNITSITFNDTVTYYDKTNGTKSYMFQWLNEDFLDTLYNNGTDVIDYTKYWNATASTPISTKPEETEATMIPTTTSPVGLLNSYEYYKSYTKAGSYGNGYLNLSVYSWLLNPYSASSVWYVRYDGGGYATGAINTFGSRPSIYLKSGISLSGSGTKESPYRLLNDFDDSNINDGINSRHSGEYIKFKVDGNNGSYDNAPLYRIVGFEGEGNNKITKIVSMNFASYEENGTTTYTKKFGASADLTGVTWGTCTSSDCWNGYFNETDASTGEWTGEWYNKILFREKLTKGTYYLGRVTDSNRNYKLAVCSSTNFDTNKTINDCINNGTIATTWNSGYVGLLRYGEMFATRQSPGDIKNIDYMWLISSSEESRVWNVNKNLYAGGGYPTNTQGARPSYYLKSDVKILSGSGTELNPYIVD